MINYLLLFLLVGTALVVIKMRDLLSSVIVFSVFSLFMALVYVQFDAPDVALTEAAIGAGISTILFLGTLGITGGSQKRSHTGRRVTAFIVTALTSAVLLVSTRHLPAFGTGDAPIHQNTTPYYLEHTQQDMGIDNVVTAILANYRAFDTLGELAVIFLAGIAISALLMNLPQKRRKGDARE